jgi:hypothetical protein
VLVPLSLAQKSGSPLPARRAALVECKWSLGQRAHLRLKLLPFRILEIKYGCSCCFSPLPVLKMTKCPTRFSTVRISEISSHEILAAVFADSCHILVFTEIPKPRIGSLSAATNSVQFAFLHGQHEGGAPRRLGKSLSSSSRRPPRSLSVVCTRPVFAYCCAGLLATFAPHTFESRPSFRRAGLETPLP